MKACYVSSALIMITLILCYERLEEYSQKEENNITKGYRSKEIKQVFNTDRCEYVSVADQNKIQIVEQLLRDFFQNLRSLIRPPCEGSGMMAFARGPIFRIVHFQELGRKLRFQMFDIETKLIEVSPCRKLSREFSFASYMFHVMDDSARSMAQYSLMKHPSHILLYHAFRVNVQLLILYNSTGDPDNTETSYNKTVNVVTIIVNNLQQRFKRLQEVPLTDSLIFRNQISRAQITLQLLKSSNSH